MIVNATLTTAYYAMRTQANASVTVTALNVTTLSKEVFNDRRM